MGRANPVAVEKVRIRGSEKVEDEVAKLVRKVADAEHARDEWGEKQRKFTRQRYGVRTKQRSVPWKGASNLNIPLIDKAIRRWKPGIIRLVTESTPVAFFVPRNTEDIENARVAENFYDWLFKTRMDSLPEVSFLADIVAHRGTGYVEVSWEYKTERRVRIARVESLFPDGLPQLQDPTTGEPLLDAQGRPQLDLNAVSQVLAQQYDLNLDRPDHVAVVEQAVNLIESGETTFKVVFREVVEDRPQVIARDPLQVIVPARETDTTNADFVAIRDLLTLDDLQRMANDGILESRQVAEVKRIIEERVSQASDEELSPGIGLSSPGNIIGDIQREDRDTIDELVGILQTHETPETVEVWKIFSWLDINGDGEKERAIIWYHPGTKTVLAKLEYTLPFAQWPLVEFTFEKTHSKRALSSRGIPQLLSALQIEVNRLHNNRLDAQAIQLAPVFLVRSAGNVTRTLRWAPGTGFPVQDTSDIQPLQQDLRNLGQYIQEEQFTRLIAEEFIGVFDAALGSAQNPSAGRTATEIEAVQAQVSGIFSLDAALWQQGWRAVHQLVFALWREIGQEEVTVRVVGEDGGPQLMRVLRHEIDKDFDIEPAGTPTNTNKAIELNRAREVMQLLWNPFTMQQGAVKPLELLRWFLASHDPKRARQLLVESEQQMADQQLIMQAASQIAESQASGEFDQLFSGAAQVPGQQAGASAR